MAHGFHTQPDEHVIVMVRKHWFVLFRDVIGTVIAAILPFFIYTFLRAGGILPAWFAQSEISTFLGSLWLILIWITLAVLWTNYYLDIWIVTDRRIVNVEQVGLFNRDLATWRMERVQEVTIRQQNVIETLLDFGSIEVQTAGPSEENAIMHGIPNPEWMQRTILGQVDIYTEAYNRDTVSRDHRPRSMPHSEAPFDLPH